MTAINPLIEDLKKPQNGELVLPKEQHVENQTLTKLEDSKVQTVEQVDKESIAQLHSPQVKTTEQNYVEAFINNKLVSKVFPDMMNWLNIGGNVFSFAAHALDLNDGIKNIAKKIGALTTKSFMIATSVINIIERCYAKNFLSAFGFFNDIIIASTVGQQDTYLARGTASGTYNMGNSLADSVGKKSFNSVDDHVASTFKAFNKFFGNLFSKDVFKNFANHENGMWAIFGGLGSNIGALTWMLGAKPELPTIVRDICGVMMDIEQLNPGHLKSGRKNFFWSGVSLAVGTLSDLFMRFVPEKSKNLLVPMTFIFDGLGRHLLRLDRNERELEKDKTVKPALKKDFNLHKAQEPAFGMAA